MANTTSAKKAARKITARTVVNRDRRGRVRTFVRKVEEAMASGDKRGAGGVEGGGARDHAGRVQGRRAQERRGAQGLAPDARVKALGA